MMLDKHYGIEAARIGDRCFTAKKVIDSAFKDGVISSNLRKYLYYFVEVNAWGEAAVEFAAIGNVLLARGALYEAETEIFNLYKEIFRGERLTLVSAASELQMDYERRVEELIGEAA